MGESSIGWLHPPAHGRRVPFVAGGQPGYSVNYWIGCSKVDPECKHCYAEREAERRRLPTFRDRSLPVWGQHAPRHFTTAATLRKVKAWDREAAEAGWPRLIFGGSQMDWLEDRADLVERRAMMLDAIEQAPNLRWILLTKRPENFARLAPRWRAGVPAHVRRSTRGSQRSRPAGGSPRPPRWNPTPKATNASASMQAWHRWRRDRLAERIRDRLGLAATDPIPAPPVG